MKTAEQLLNESNMLKEHIMPDGLLKYEVLDRMQAYAEQAVKLELEKAAEKARCSTESCSDGFETWETYGVKKPYAPSPPPPSLTKLKTQ